MCSLVRWCLDNPSFKTKEMYSIQEIMLAIFHKKSSGEYFYCKKDDLSFDGHAFFYCKGSWLSGKKTVKYGGLVDTDIALRLLTC